MNDQRLLHHAVDDELVLGRIDVRHAAMADGEMQAVRGDDALEQMMRRAGARIARLVLRIVDGAHHRLLEPRRLLVRRNGVADLEAPRPVLERLGGGSGGADGARAHGAGQHDASPEQGAAVEQAVAGHLLDLEPSYFRWHGLSLGRYARAVRPVRARGRCGAPRSMSPRSSHQVKGAGRRGPTRRVVKCSSPPRVSAIWRDAALSAARCPEYRQALRPLRATSGRALRSRFGPFFRLVFRLVFQA